MGTGSSCWAVLGAALAARDERLARGDYGDPGDPEPGLAPWEGASDWDLPRPEPWAGPRLEFTYIPRGKCNAKYRKRHGRSRVGRLH